jgi:hypothetical protein
MKKLLLLSLSSFLLSQATTDFTDIHDVSNSKSKKFTQSKDIHDISDSKSLKYVENI